MISEADISGLTGGIVSIGDLSYANGDEPKWDTFGNLRTITSTSIPTFTTLGNHEWFDDDDKLFTAYRARFDNPPAVEGGEKELYYSFEAGLVHWAMVAGYCHDMKSTSTQPCLAEGSPQMDWLQADLAGVNRSVTPWVVVAFHQPYVNSNTAHSISTEGYPMQEAIEDVLYENGVDLVFSGHVHAYERSCEVYQYKCVAGAPVYVTIGDGGNHEGLARGWVEPQPDWSVYRQASYGFGRLRVFNATTALWQWHQNQDLAPTIADEHYFVKEEGEGGKRVFRGEASPLSSHTTGTPQFAANDRGRKAAADNYLRQAMSTGRD